MKSHIDNNNLAPFTFKSIIKKDSILKILPITSTIIILANVYNLIILLYGAISVITFLSSILIYPYIIGN